MTSSLAVPPNTTTASANGTAPPPWRQFTFFDAETVKDVHDLQSTPDVFKATPELSTVISSSHGVLVADIHGSIHLLNNEFESAHSWIGHVGGRVTHMAERNGLLVTLGEEDAVKGPLIKIWDLENFDKLGAPILLRSTKVQLNNRPHPVTTIALSRNVVHLAIGLGDGTVILYKGLDQSLASSTALTALPKTRVIHESPSEPITGLGFREPTDEYPNEYLYIVTTNRVLSFQVTGRSASSTAGVVDEIGTGLGCATMDWKAKDIVVAKDEAIYLCGVEGRGACYAYEGLKTSVHTHGNYLVIVSPPFFPSATSTSATVRNFVARNAKAGETDITKVTVFDPENKLVAYSGPFKQGVREVVSQWGNIYVLGTDGTLTCLREKSTSTKLDMLYRKSLFQLALNLSVTQNLDASSVADIHKQYGDHLYLKGDYDGAMQQYVQTIGSLQPSYVIRKYLDAQRIHNLVTYLQELHSLGLANADHTTLLLNTYTKLKDVARLDSFIKTESKRSADPTQGHGEDELPFDLDTAIRVCRQAGYFDHASYLAKKYERHEDYLSIQIEDAGRYEEALSYLRKLGSEAAEGNLARYGRALLQHLPQETTQLLIDLCTTSGSLFSDSPTDENPADDSISKPVAPVPSYLSYLSLNRAATTTAPVTSDVAATTAGTTTNTAAATPPSPSIKTVTANRREGSVFQDNATITRATPPISPGLPSGDPTPARHPTRSASLSISVTGLPPMSAASTTGGFPTGAATGYATGFPSALGTAVPLKPKTLSPRVYFAHFVDHLEQFVVFLEEVARRRWGMKVDDLKPGEIGLLGPASGATASVKKKGGKVMVYDPTAPTAGDEEWEGDEIGSGSYGAEDNEEADDKADQVAVWNTLLELYLTLPVQRRKTVTSASSPPASSPLPPDDPKNKGKPALATASTPITEKTMRDKALRVLTSSTIPYDNTHALLLCSTHGFTPGLVILWEKLGMYEDVLRFWMDRHRNPSTSTSTSGPDSSASHKVIEHLMTYTQTLDDVITSPSSSPAQVQQAKQRQRQMYSTVLRFLTENSDIVAKHREDLEQILGYIDQEDLLPPLSVVQVLSRNGVASVGLVKEWLVRRIKTSRSVIQNDQELTKSYRLETASKLKQVEELSDTVNSRVFHVTRCTTCQAQLDLPSVHFMCHHSYHQRCIAENETECPACVREHGVIREIKLNNEKLADQHDVFISEVQENGFNTIASAFSRGVLNIPKVEEGVV